MTEGKSKNKLFLKSVIIAAVFLLLLIIPIILTSFSSYSVLVTTTGSRYYKAKKILIIGNSILCIRDSNTHKNKNDAISIIEADYKLSLVNIKKVRNIEIIQEEEKAEDEDTERLSVKPKYLGKYKIIASGHKGYLTVYVHKNRLYGSIKFPGWAKGVTEPLKRISIRNNRIRFTRSITTKKELKRIGAQSYFKQQYYGTYNNSGKKIKGQYVVRGTKNMWEANRIK